MVAVGGGGLQSGRGGFEGLIGQQGGFGEEESVECLWCFFSRDAVVDLRSEEAIDSIRLYK